MPLSPADKMLVESEKRSERDNVGTIISNHSADARSCAHRDRQKTLESYRIERQDGPAGAAHGLNVGPRSNESNEAPARVMFSVTASVESACPPYGVRGLPGTRLVIDKQETGSPRISGDRSASR